MIFLEKVISYEWIPSNWVDINLKTECAILYSNHYGKWSTCSPIRPGDDIRLSCERISQWLSNESSSIYLARNDKNLVGYAIAIRLKIPQYGVISWVTQLVVHEEFRKRNIAKNLLFSIWGLSDHFAWGIVSANPYAIRALEKATRRRCDPQRIKRNIRKIISIGVDNIPYIQDTVDYEVNETTSKINTEFFVDHSLTNEMILSVTKPDIPWKFGNIEEGWEWLAFTFRDQEQFKLSQFEINKMIETSDSITQKAFERMIITEKHSWTNYTDDEVNFIIEECNLEPGDSIVDFGCGVGRHSILLANRGFKVIGVDYIEKNIIAARKNDIKKLAQFITGDCRAIKLSPVKSIICLYDVIGSFIDDEENIKILKNISDHLVENGTALISVMNYDTTYVHAKHKFKLSTDSEKLLELRPSTIMEQTGNVFNPDFYLVDEETKIVYRKEQFISGNSLPMEVIVRDKRFTKSEIEYMCECVGLEVVFSRYVSARSWREELSSTEKSAKEILIKCKKRKRN